MRAIHSAARQQLMSADIQSRLASIAQLTFQTYALAVERAKALELPVAEPPLPASAFRPPPSVDPPSRMAPSFVTESEADDILRRILVARQAEHPDSRCGATPAAVPSAKEPAPCPKKVAAETVAKPAAEGGSPISVDNWAQRSKQIAQLMMANEAREMEARERLAQAKKRLKERHILPTTGLALPDLPKANPTASAKIEARIWKAAIESPLNADGLGKKPTLEELKEFGIVPSMTGSLSPALKDFEGTLGEIDYDDYDDDGEDEEDDNDEEDPDYVPSDDSEDEDDEDDDEDEDEDEPEQEEPKLEEQEDEEEEHEDATALLQELHQKRAELARMDAAIQRLYEEGEDYALEEEEKEEEEEEMDEEYGTATAASPLGRTFASAVAALPDYQYIDGMTASEDDEDEVEDVPWAARTDVRGISEQVVTGRVLGSAGGPMDARRAPMEPPRSPLKVSTGDEGAPRSPPESRTPVSPGRYDYEEEVHDQIERPPASPGRYDYEEEAEEAEEEVPVIATILPLHRDSIGLTATFNASPVSEGIPPKTAPQGRSFPRESLDTFTASPVGEGMPPKTAKERHTLLTTGAPYVPAAPADELTSADTARLEELSALLVQLDALRTQTEESLKASAPPKRKKLTEAQMRQASNELSRALGGM